jgi:hypothetical protein
VLLYDLISSSTTTAEALFKHIENHLIQGQIPFTNIISICADGATNMSKLHDTMLTHNPRIIFVSCICHRLNLIVQHSMKFLPSNYLQTLNDIYSYFSRSSPRTDELLKLQEKYNQKPHKLFRYVNTRWTSFYTCLERVIENWDVLTELFKKKDLTLHKFLTTTEYKLLSLFFEALFRRLKDLSELFQSEAPKHHVVSDEIHSTYKYYLSFLVRDCILDWPDEMILHLDLGNSSNLVGNQEIMNRVAACLNLNKLNIKESDYATAQPSIVNTITSMLIGFCQLYKKYALDDYDEYLMYLSFDPTKRLVNRKFKALLTRFYHLVGKDEDVLVKQYENFRSTASSKLPNMDQNLDQFWGEIITTERLHLSELGKFMTSILTIPNSNGATERFFSTLKQTKTEKRNRLKQETLTALLATKVYFDNTTEEGRDNLLNKAFMSKIQIHNDNSMEEEEL